MNKKLDTATFAAGCFWGVEAAFHKIKGVKSVTSGYTGGRVKNPTYEEVCTNGTGHAEAVEIMYDSSVVNYDELLNAFWKMHDPTQLNRQGPDVGDQYRSAIFYHNEDQKRTAEASKASIGEAVTEIAPASDFYHAEDYHQRYIEKNGGVCHI